jgi:hypothetical protein
VITDSGEILNTASADENNRVFLKVVAFSRNIRSDLIPVG